MILFDPVTESRGLFDPPAVRALWSRHLSGAELWTVGKVAPLMTIELVLRHLFIENAADERSLLGNRAVASER